MNKHIYKVIKWLENPESVSQEERDKNKEEASDAAADAADAAYSASVAFYDAAYAAACADAAAAAAAENKPEEATRWVNKYLQVTGKNKQDYLDAIEGEK